MKRFAALASATAFLTLSLFCASAQAKSADTAPAATAAPAAKAESAASSAPAPAPVSAAAAAEIAGSLKLYTGASTLSIEVIKKAATLSSSGKWMSAYQALDDFDKVNADPFALAMKTSLILWGMVRTDMDRSFGLVDLQEGQDLDSLRQGEGDYKPIAFDPPALAETQASKGVKAPGILSKALGDYYYDVISRYSGQWAISDDEILAKIAEHYSKAYSAGSFDRQSLQNYAETLVRLNRGDDSDPIYKKALELDPKGANLLYSYAMGLYYRGKKAEAYPIVDRAIEAYGKDSARVNAIALGARIAAELGDGAKADTYFAIAEKEYPDTPTAGMLRQMVAIQVGNKAAALAAADGLLAAYGSNPNVIRTLVSSWYAAGDPASAREFLQRGIAKGGNDMLVGTLYFYLAVLLAQDSPSDADKAEALKALDGAETHLKASLGPENEVYGVITGMRESLQPKSPEPAPAAGASPDASKAPK